MTDFLFARPSFLEGAARLLDIGGTLQEYNKSATPEEADRRAIHSDWNAVFQDLQDAMDVIEEEVSKRKNK